MPLTVYTGPMFAGKSDHLLQEIEQARAAGLNIIVYKPSIDTRQNGIRSRAKGEYPAIAIKDLDHWAYYHRMKTKVIVIDEGHMFDDHFVAEVGRIQYYLPEIHVVIAGVDLNCMTKPFITMARLIHMADRVVRLMSECNYCGKTAAYTYRDSDDTAEIVVGDDIYSPICYDCLATHDEPGLSVVLTRKELS